MEKTLQGNCLSKPSDYRCFIGGHDNLIKNVGNSNDSFFETIPFEDVDDATEIINAADPFSKTFRNYDKCAPQNVIRENHANYTAPSFHAMGHKYRVYRDFNGRNRYVRTTPGAFEKGFLNQNGCRY